MPHFLVNFVLLRENFESLLNQLQQPSLVKSGKWEQYLVKKIPFHLSTTQKKVFSSLEDVLCGKMSTTDLVLLTPNLSPSCPKCSSQFSSQTTQALCFLKKQTWQCEGKKFLALIPISLSVQEVFIVMNGIERLKKTCNLFCIVN